MDGAFSLSRVSLFGPTRRLIPVLVTLAAMSRASAIPVLSRSHRPHPAHCAERE